MNFLSRLVFPESGERLELLRYLLVIVALIFVTYASIVLIASTVSAIADSWGRNKGEKSFSRFARDLADLAVPSGGSIFAMAVIPLITEILIYGQLLYGMSIGITTYLTVAAVFFFIGLYFLYTYKKSFHLASIYSTFHDLAASHDGTIASEVSADVQSYEKSAGAARQKGGRRGVVLLWIGTWIFVGTTRLALTPDRWAASSFLTVLFSGETFWSLVTYVTTAVAITSAAIVFFFFRWEKRISFSAEPSYMSFVRKYTLPAGLVAAALEPVLIFFEIQNLPEGGVSDMTFAIACVGMFVALLIMLLFYSMLKESGINLGSYAFVGAIILILVWAGKDEIAFRYATEGQDQLLATRYETMLASLSPKAPPPVRSGEDIYSAICSACHRFDVKLVGPPYFQTLPHFVGKMDSLEDFISNPYQAVPGYPPMPKQPLKPEEVKNVAEYIMSVYLKSRPQDTLKTARKRPV
ncbi:MAG: c-type cytochrome [Candidatus Kryptoniota bacterium]